MAGGQPGGTGMCPPAGPFGTGEGDVSPDVTLSDCDGNLYSVHDLCERDAAWIMVFAGWCSTCRVSAPQANALWERFRSQNFQAYFVIADDNQASPPDAAYCAQIREQYGLTMPVLFDADGSFVNALQVPTNDVHIVFGVNNEIVHKTHKGFSGVEGIVESTLR